MFTQPELPNPAEPGLLALVMTALQAKGRLEDSAPLMTGAEYFSRENLLELHIDKQADGWVANIEFSNVPPGQPNCVGTPDRAPFDDPMDAFLAGPALVCEIATGSSKLPFFISGGKLICVAYR